MNSNESLRASRRSFFIRSPRPICSWNVYHVVGYFKSSLPAGGRSALDWRLYPTDGHQGWVLPSSIRQYAAPQKSRVCGIAMGPIERRSNPLVYKRLFVENIKVPTTARNVTGSISKAREGVREQRYRNVPSVCMNR